MYNKRMVILFFLGIAIMAGIIFLAVSPKSEFKVRVAALGALAVMVVTTIICIVLYFKAAATPQQLILPDMLPSDMPPPPPNASPATMIMLIVFLVALFVGIFFLSWKEQKRVEDKEEPPSNDW